MYNQCMEDNQKYSKLFATRRYRHGDFEGIKQLWSATGLDDPRRSDNEDIIEDSVKMGGSLIILYEKETQRICGTSWMTFDGRRLYLHHFGILPEFQGKGLSKVLLKESLSFVRKKGYQVKLEVNKKNIIATKLYRNFGFKSLGDYDIYIIRDVSNLH